MITVNTVKEQTKRNDNTVVIGYLLNGKMSVPLSQGNRHYKAIQEWITEGNTPEPAYTQAELDAYVTQTVSPRYMIERTQQSSDSTGDGQ